ncbi:MAG: methylmalonyl Co-A mutase-associated GTPase MeaB [Rhodobacteraceae bacterium]|nr:methylmalonyl Co-A mutase-associated GTPase MeaB [Paracoccaceae bacterium]
MAARPRRSAEESEALAARALAGDRAALARVLSDIERGADTAAFAMHGGTASHKGAWTIGLTGAPGAGKSTLLGALLSHAARLGERTAALAVDPSSPISGGALLGDRLRMPAIATDPDIYVRSMASRGRAGGLADMTRAAVRCLHACGWPRVFVETVGIGQLDIDVSTVADLVIVVLNPGAGDEVQVSKAGLMEIADLFVINKADHPGARTLRQDLAGMIATLPAGRYRPGVHETVATTGEGVEKLWTAIADNLAQAERSGALHERRARRAGREVIELADAMLKRRLEAVARSDLFDGVQEAVLAGEMSLNEAAARMVGAMSSVSDL